MIIPLIILGVDVVTGNPSILGLYVVIPLIPGLDVVISLIPGLDVESL